MRFMLRRLWSTCIVVGARRRLTSGCYCSLPALTSAQPLSAEYLHTKDYTITTIFKLCHNQVRARVSAGQRTSRWKKVSVCWCVQVATPIFLGSNFMIDVLRWDHIMYCVFVRLSWISPTVWETSFMCAAIICHCTLRDHLLWHPLVRCAFG